MRLGLSSAGLPYEEFRSSNRARAALSLFMNPSVLIVDDEEAARYGIRRALEKQGYTIDRRKIVLDEPIRTLGEFKVPLRLHRDVTTEIAVHVVKEEE